MPSTHAASQGAGQMRPVNSGKVIRRVQQAQCFFPSSGVNEFVPVGNQVIHRAAVVAERDPAIHASNGLNANLRFGKRLVDFEPVVDALGHGAARRDFACVFQEAGMSRHTRLSASAP